MKKLSALLVIGIVFLLISGISFASYWVWSNYVTVQVKTIALNLSAPSEATKYNNILLVATLTQNGVQMGDGYTVEFGKGSSASDFASIGTNTTINGVATFTYNITETNSVNFIARYNVP